MLSCACGFETSSIRTLRSHYAANHEVGGAAFFENFKDEIITNWVSFPGKTIRGFMLWYAGYRCSACGYDKTRECGTTILEVDHIDGDHSNNDFVNLRVLCPNCHALTPKYRNWSNTGNKKNTKIIRPGNIGYDDRHIVIKTRKMEKLRLREEKNVRRKLEREAKLSDSQTFTYQFDENQTCNEFTRIKKEFQQNFIKKVEILHESGEIDFGEYGWVQILSDLLGEKPQIVGRRVRNLLPDFYAKHCYRRTYNHYVKLNMERIRPDEGTALKTVAG